MQFKNIPKKLLCCFLSMLFECVVFCDFLLKPQFYKDSHQITQVLHSIQFAKDTPIYTLHSPILLEWKLGQKHSWLLHHNSQQILLCPWNLSHQVNLSYPKRIASRNKSFDQKSRRHEGLFVMTQRSAVFVNTWGQMRDIISLNKVLDMISRLRGAKQHIIGNLLWRRTKLFCRKLLSLLCQKAPHKTCVVQPSPVWKWCGDMAGMISLQKTRGVTLWTKKKRRI